MRPPTDPILGIAPADPSLRRIALFAWGALAIVGAAGIWYLTDTLRDAQAMAVYDPRGAFIAIQHVVVPIVIAGVILTVTVALYCLVNAMRIIRAGRFPAPGARLVRATPIRRGAAAHRVGVALAALALLMLAASVAMPVFLQRVLRAVEASDHRFPATPPDAR